MTQHQDQPDSREGLLAVTDDDVTAQDREALAREYEAGGYDGPYPSYADLALTGKGAFTMCSLRAIAATRLRAKATTPLARSGEAG